MNSLEQRKVIEINHGKKIINGAECFWWWDTPAGKMRAERRKKMIFDSLALNSGPGKKCLELGCGTGNFTEYFADKGAKITAVDISPDLLEKAKKKIGNKKNVEFKTADIHNLPFENNTFDYIFGVSVIHHLDLPTAFKEISRVLKENGTVVFSEPNMLNPQMFIQKNVLFIKRLMGDTITETAFYKWKIKGILRKFGFEEIEVFPFDFLHPSIPSFLCNFFSRFGLILEKIPVLREFAGSLFISAKLKKR